MKYLGLGCVAAALVAAPVMAQQAQGDDAGEVPMIVADASRAIERISVIAQSERKDRIPGSAQLIDEMELETFEYTDIQRILRLVPGVNIQEEDGYGLRPNIGLRGSGVERSERITLMEDGVLIAPAPYAAPAAYYFPTAGRMSGVEVTKGPSAIKYGPRTVGGAINMLSTPIPDETGGKLEARYGSDNFYVTHGTAAIVTENVSGLVEGYISGADGFKKLDGGGDTGFNIEDFTVKLRVNSDDDADRYHSLEIKASITNNDSNETYLGLTDDDFAATPFRRYAASQLDNIDTKHKQFQATHFIELADNIDLTTVGYYNEFERDWFKIDDLDFGDGRFRPSAVFADPDSFPDVLAVFRGEADSPNDALQLRHNAREYYSWGIQSVANIRFATGAASHELEIGVRWHEDEEDRCQNRENFRMESGEMILTSIGDPCSQANRKAQAEALAIFIQDEISYGRWTFLPGLRFEHIELTRFDYSTADPSREMGPTQVRENKLDVFIPGFGLTFEAADGFILLAGVNRGFSPPGPGSTVAEEEKSWNYEAGLRYTADTLYIELIGFYSDYSNILATCTASIGCDTGDIGDQFNGGAVDVLGLEFIAQYDVRLGNGLIMPLRMNYTLTDAEFGTSFEDSFWGDVVKGDALPYIPEHQLYLSVGLQGDVWGLTVGMNVVSAVRTTAGQGPIPTDERVAGHVVFDLAGYYQIADNIRLFAAVENLFDNTYPVARRPYGLRPGKPLTASGGLTVTF